MRQWCKARGIACPGRFRPDWEAALRLTGRREAAGPMRNRKMAEEHPDLCLAFPGHRGTQSAVYEARRAGVPVIRARDVLEEAVHGKGKDAGLGSR